MEAYSVLMAVYFREKPEHLRLAIRSMLCQTVAPEEFVLVCDGPLTPPLDAVIGEFCRAYPALFRVVRLERNQGLGAALNAGLLYCRNELVARMDSDDLAVRDRMEMQLAELERYPDTSVLGGQIAEFAESPETITGCRCVPLEPAQIREYLKFRNPMNHTTAVLRRSHVLRVGGYREVAGFEDYFLWTKLIKAGCLLRSIPQICCMVRADAGMYSRRGGWQYFQNARKLERFLLESQIITCRQYWRNTAIRFIGTMVLPAGLRRQVFLKFLRAQPGATAFAPNRIPSAAGPSAPFFDGDIFFSREPAGQIWGKR